MGRILKPMVRGGGWYPSKKWIPLVKNGGYTTQNGGETEPVWATVSGAIASFTTPFAYPLKKLVAQINPVQDLHGQSSPYPAGGGKNQFICYNNTTTAAGLTFELRDHYVVITGTCTVYTSLNLNFGGAINVGATLENGSAYTWSAKTEGTIPDTLNIYGGYTGTSTRQTGLFAPSGSQTLTIPADGSYKDRVWIAVHAGEVYNGTLYIQTEKGSVKTSYAPYSNICPISGWTGVQGQRTGKNLLDTSGISQIVNGMAITVNNNVISYSGTASYNGYGLLVSSKLPKVGQYHFRLDGDGAWLRGYTYLGKDVTVDVTDTDQIYRLSLPSFTAGNQYSGTISNAQIELGSTASSYSEYTGEPISVTFPTTIYGGTDEVIGGQGVSDMEEITLTGQETYNNQYFPTVVITTNLPKTGDYSRRTAVIGNYTNYPKVAFASNSAQNLQFSNVDTFWNVASADELKAKFATLYASGNPVKVVYPILQPQSFTHEGQEVDTLVGQNNIFVDTGSVEVTYPADTKLYIDKKIAEALA